MRPILPIIIVLVLAQGLHAGVYLTITRSSSGVSARQAAAREARREVLAAQSELSRVYAMNEVEHPLAQEIRQAKRELVRARLRYAEVRLERMRQVDDLPRMRELNMEIRLGSEALAATKDAGKRYELAERLLKLRTERSRIVTDELAGDVELTIAQARMQKSSNQLGALEREYQSALTSDDRFAAARARLDAARQRLASVSG